MLRSMSSRCFRRGGANSATLLIVLLAQYYYPSCAFLTPSAASTTSRSNLGLLSGQFQREFRQGLRQTISLSSSSTPPSPSEPSVRSQPPPKPARTPAATSKKSTRATPASSTSSPLAFGGRVKRKIEVEEASPGSPRAEGLPVEKIGKGEEKQEDVRKSARWGGKPSSPPNPGVRLMINPLKAAGSSLKVIGRGATAAKDVLYDAADGISAVSGLSTEIVRQRGDGSSKGPTVGNTVRVDNNTGSKEGGVIGALKLVGGGAVIAKDALWSAIDLLGDAADALGKAPDTARSVAEGGRATLQAAKANVEAVARAPGAAVGVASDAVGSIAGVMGGIKDSAYGVADATARLASLPGEVAERRRLEKQERDRIEAEREAKQKENARRFASTVTSTKDLVWSTIDGVGTFADTVVSAPAIVSEGLGKAGEGLGKAQDAVVSAGELLGSIPRTVQEIPLEVQRRVDGVIASVESAQDTGKAVASAVGGTIDGASRFVKKGADIATGKERRERQERERRAEEERRKEKERNALLRIQGEPYTAQDLAIGALKTVGIAAKSAFGVGKAFVTVASTVPSAPAKVARTVLGPLYEYRQSTKRVRDAVKEEASSRPSALTASATEIAPTATAADVPFEGNSTSASENQDDRVKEGVPSVMEGNVQRGDAETVGGIEGRKAWRSWDKFDSRKK